MIHFSDGIIIAILLICFSIIILNGIITFKNRSKEDQFTMINEWLLNAVTQAEKLFGSGTGQLKLSYVYDLFLQRFPQLKSIISFDTFSSLVDNSLDQLKTLIKENKNIEKYIKEE